MNRFSSLMIILGVIFVIICMPKIVKLYIVPKERKILNINGSSGQINFFTPNGQSIRLILKSKSIDLHGKLLLINGGKKENIFFSKKISIVYVMNNKKVYNYVITNNKETGKNIILESNSLYNINIKLNKLVKEEVSLWVKYLDHI